MKGQDSSSGDMNRLDSSFLLLGGGCKTSKETDSK